MNTLEKQVKDRHFVGTKCFSFFITSQKAAVFAPRMDRFLQNLSYLIYWYIIDSPHASINKPKKGP